MKSIAIIPVFREAGKVGRVLERFEPGSVDQVCLILDNPDDRIISEIEESKKRSQVPVLIIKNPERKGIGYAIKEGYQYALSNGFTLIVVMAGNGKDDPKEIMRLTEPILKGNYDYVKDQGSSPEGDGRRLPCSGDCSADPFPSFGLF